METWNCPICAYKTTDKELKNKHIQKEFDKKYFELEKLSTETAVDGIKTKAMEVWKESINKTNNFVSGYKSLISF